MAIGREEIIWAYRILLEREPDSPELVDQLTSILSNRWELVRAILLSEEFRLRNPFDGASLGNSLSASCLVITEIEPGVRLFVDLSDIVIGLNVARKSYEPSEVAFVKRLLEPGQVVLDVGANVGFYTMLVASRVGPSGHVYSYEPVPANADLLERSLRENAYEPRVTLTRAVVGDRAGQERLIHLPLSKNAYNSGGSYLAAPGTAPPREHEVLEVPMLKIDDLDFGRQVALIKIDVEGAEPLVFRGARELLARDRPLILAEINPAQLAKVSGCTARQLLDEMEALGYRCLELRDGTLQPLGDDDLEGDISSVVFAPLEAPERLQPCADMMAPRRAQTAFDRVKSLLGKFARAARR